MSVVKYTKSKSKAYTLYNKVTQGLMSYDCNVWAVLLEYKKDIAIAGGSIRAILSKTFIQDMDIYVSDMDIVSLLIKKFVILKYTVVASTDNAVTLKNTETNKIIQIIKKVLLDVSNPADLLEEFDFTITQAVFYNDTLYLGETFLEDLASRSLIITNKHLKYPIASLVRVLKYQRYGFIASPLLLVNIALQTHALEINTYAQLKEQLQGIDTQIFDSMLSHIDERLTFSLPDVLSHISENYFNFLEN